MIRMKLIYNLKRIHLLYMEIQKLPLEITGRLEKIIAQGKVKFEPQSNYLRSYNDMDIEYSIFNLDGNRYFAPFLVPLILQGANIQLSYTGVTRKESKPEKIYEKDRPNLYFRHKLVVLDGVYKDFTLYSSPITRYKLDKVIYELEEQINPKELYLKDIVKEQFKEI